MASRIKVVGAWTGQYSLGNPQRDVDLCRKIGINRLDIFVNDHSTWRTEKPFTTYKTSRVIELAQVARAGGLDVNLVSWIMPFEGYITEAGRQLRPLLEASGASSIQWDAEEPWTQADGAGRLPYPTAAALVAEQFSGVRMGANGIGYTPANKFGPLAAVCDYLIPQCYSTNTSGMRPDEVVGRCITRWRGHFGDRPYEIGLAAYRQTGISGFTPREAMQAPIRSVRELGFDTVVYWALSSIAKSPDAQAVISEARAGVDGAEIVPSGGRGRVALFLGGLALAGAGAGVLIRRRKRKKK